MADTKEERPEEVDETVSPEERLEPRTVNIDGAEVRRGDKKPVPIPDDEGITELKRQLSNAQSQTARVSQIAQAEHSARVNAERSVATSNVSMVDQAIESARRDSEQARSYFQQALDRGDHKGASEAQILISDARANLLRLMEMREGLGSEPPPQRQQPQQAPRQAPPADPAAQMQMNVDNLSSHLDRTGFPKSAAWIRDHPDMVRDRAAINKVDGAHGYAVNTLGLIPETQDYFDKIEELLGVGETPAPRQSARPAAAGRMAAPARNEAPSLRTGQTRGSRVTLSALQREHARDVLGMTDEEYAAELLDAQSRGKMLGAR